MTLGDFPMTSDDLENIVINQTDVLGAIPLSLSSPFFPMTSDDFPMTSDDLSDDLPTPYGGIPGPVGTRLPLGVHPTTAQAGRDA